MEGKSDGRKRRLVGLFHPHPIINNTRRSNLEPSCHLFWFCLRRPPSSFVCVSALLTLFLLSYIIGVVLREGNSFLLLGNENVAGTFVERRDGHLWLGGSIFRFGGTNIYWLGLDENVDGVGYPTKFRIEDALETCVEMGVTVVRAHTLGISIGNPLSFSPSLGVFNVEALDAADYAVKIAGDLGIRLIVPLTDNWDYYHGGRKVFTRWRNLNDDSQFYTDRIVIDDYKKYVRELLTHTNRYTGLPWNQDPTFLAWETGNELHPPSEWTEEIANLLKQIAPRHLVVDGSWGLSPSSLNLDSIDIISGHYYVYPAWELLKDTWSTAWKATSAGKAFIVGEYDWRGVGLARSPMFLSLSPFLSIARMSNHVSGTMFWSLFPHHDGHGFVHHQDQPLVSYTLHYPGDDHDMKVRAQALRAHAFRMSGLTPPPHRVPPAPLILSVDASGIRWRGARGAATYIVEVALKEAGPWIAMDLHGAMVGVSDNDLPLPHVKLSLSGRRSGPPGGRIRWTRGFENVREVLNALRGFLDEDEGQGVWYRVKPFNLAGVGGAPSHPFFVSV